MLLFVAQSMLRLVLISLPMKRYAIEMALIHLLDLAALSCAAILLLTLARGRKLPQILIALALAAVGILLSAFDLFALISAWFHQRVPALATVPIFYCNAETISGCIRPFPLISAVIAGAWLLWTWLIYRSANALSAQSMYLLRPLTFAGKMPRLPFGLIALFLAVWGGMWLAAFAHMSVREPLVRFVGKTPFGPEPRALLTVHRPDYHVVPSPEVKPRLLVLISIDSLRADAVELVANNPSRTPFLQSLSAGGKLHDYGPAVAVCPTSYCGIIGMLSSSDWATLQNGPPLTIADVLAVNGYTSHYLLSGPHRRALNFAKLYGPNVTTMLDDSSDDSSGLADDREQVRRLRDLKIADPNRSFVFVHLMSAHGAGLRFAGSKSGGTYRNNYHGGVLQADMVVRQIFDVLRARGWLDDALVIITADHGERLTGAVGHGGAVDLSTAPIPLLVYDPKSGAWPRTKNGIASQIDIVPSLLHAVNVDLPEKWRGQPLQSGAMRVAAPTDTVGQSALVTRMGDQIFMVKCDLRTGKHAVLPSGLPASAEMIGNYAKWSRDWNRRNDTKRCYAD